MTGDAVGSNERWLVVLVDDDDTFLSDYGRGLQLFSVAHSRREVEIATFNDAREAMEFAGKKTGRRWLWILDSMMPFRADFSAAETRSGLLTGVSMLKRLREIQTTERAVRFVILTNYAKEEVEAALGDAGIDGVVSKLHCTPRQLAAKVDGIIMGR
jgi:CheY-like chemotaxis protein